MRFIKIVTNKLPWLYPLYFYSISCVFDYIRAIAYIVRLKQIKREEDIYILTNSPIGDTVYSMAFIKAFKESHPDKSVVILGYKSRDSIYRLYKNSFHKIEYVDSEHKNIMAILRRKALIRILKRYNIYSAYPYFYRKVPFNTGETTLDVIKRDLLALEYDANIQLPIVPSQIITSIDNFNEIKSRVAILNPYSTSMYGIEMGIYEAIAEFLISQGFVVYTNALSTQQTIKNTYRLECSIYELYEICKHIPLVVSTRSGIIDFLISSSCNFYVYYFQIKRGGMRWINNPIQNFYNYFRLEAWNTFNVTEHIYESVDESLSHFINFFNKQIRHGY